MIRILTRLVLQGLKDARHHPLSQLMTLGAVGLMVFLAGLFLIFLNTLDSQLAAEQGEVVIQVYWRNNTDSNVLRGQWEEISHLPGLAKWQTYTPEEALNTLAGRLQQSAGVDVTALAGKNPLPPTAIMHFMPADGDQAKWREETLRYLEKLPGVAKVQVNPLREEVARAWREISRKIMLPAICMLSGILALVVGNTVRLSLISRRTEIEILQLVGARNWYIRMPLITTGAGDHFNAGFMHGRLLGLPPENCLTVGVCTSGHYVRTAHSPTSTTSDAPTTTETIVMAITYFG